MTLIKRIVYAGGLIGLLETAAYSQVPYSALWHVQAGLRALAWAEPARQGPLHDMTRGQVALVHAPDSPRVRFVTPTDGGEFAGYLAAKLTNWTVRPGEALHAGREFAGGKQERNVGHTHTWIYDVDTGAQVRFTGASGLLLNEETGLHESVPFTLPPGRYKAFVTLQNHDHTTAIPASAPTLPPIDCVLFEVTGDDPD